jgi:hypothetical protein
LSTIVVFPEGVSRMTGAPDRQPTRDVEYKGEPLDAAKGPGLGCFWLQIVALVVVMVLTPLSAAWNWPIPVTIVLLATTLVLLLFVGQTVIFLLRLVAADRREARRRPLRSATKTVGELEDERVDAEDERVDAEDERAEPGDERAEPSDEPTVRE